MKPFAAGILVAGVLLAGSIVLLNGGKAIATSDESTSSDAISNAEFVDGTQIVTIVTKGGYRPGTTEIKAGVPTVLRFKTNGTFDCSSSIRIPSLDIARNLPPTGVTDVPVGTLQPGTLQGTCGMGMYRFSVSAS